MCVQNNDYEFLELTSSGFDVTGGDVLIQVRRSVSTGIHVFAQNNQNLMSVTATVKSMNGGSLIITGNSLLGSCTSMVYAYSNVDSLLIDVTSV